MSGNPSIKITTPGGATNAVTTTLSGTASGLNFPAVTIYDNGVEVGGGSVVDGLWSGTVVLRPGDNSYTAAGIPKLDPGVSSAPVVLTDVQTAPTIAAAQAGGETSARVQTLSGTATTAGYGARFTTGMALTLSDNGKVLGHATVGLDGSWSAQIGLASLGRNLVTVSGTDLAGNTGSALVGFDLKTSLPAVAITSPGGTVTQPVQTISGTATAGDTGDVVTLIEDGAAIGTAAVGNDGTWALVTILAAGHHTFEATDADRYGNVGASNAIACTLAVPPAVAFGPAPQLSGTTAILTGTASDAVGVAGVEIFQGATALGAAQVNPDGTWSFTHDFGQGTYDHLTAVAMDQAGLGATASAAYALVTGASFGRRSSGVVETLAADGSVASATTYATDGSFGAQTVAHGAGTATATGYENGQALFSIGGDVMTGNGYGENFVFQPTMGHARITDFVVSGPGHDTITLSHQDFDNVLQVLNKTTMNHGSAVIHVSPTDTIRLAGVTRADLAQHRGDFAFMD